MWCAVEGLGGEASCETEIVPRVRGGFVWAVPRGWVVFGVQIGPLRDLERIWALWAQLPNCVLRLLGRFSPMIRLSLIMVPDSNTDAIFVSRNTVLFLFLMKKYETKNGGAFCRSFPTIFSP